MPIGVHALVGHTDHVSATIADGVEGDVVSNGTVSVTGMYLVSRTPSMRVVCEPFQTRLKITQIDPGLLQPPALFAVTPDMW